MRKRIFLFVMLVHCMLIFSMAVHNRFFAKKQRQGAIAVHTIRPQSTAPIVVQKAGAVAAPKKANAAVKKSPAASGAKKPIPAAKKTVPIIQKKEEEGQQLPAFDVKIPAFLEPAKEQPLPVAFSPCYGDFLTQTLQERLQLPEMGEVRARLVVSSQGKILSMEVLEAKSKKNSEWLKSQLPQLLLPEFREFGILEATLEFTITFHNAERS